MEVSVLLVSVLVLREIARVGLAGDCACISWVNSTVSANGNVGSGSGTVHCGKHLTVQSVMLGGSTGKVNGIFSGMGSGMADTGPYSSVEKLHIWNATVEAFSLNG
jgi:hypothetical protein